MSTNLTAYNKEFFGEFLESSRKSARCIVPMVMESLSPKSVLDVGCGWGVWLSEWKGSGAEVQGIDGTWVNTEHLLIDKTYFQHKDLEKPFELNKVFDLVTSFEVAEHIVPEHAGLFVQSLTRHSDKVLFSAAIPLQGGVGHVNEQWPSYWVRHFEKQGFVVLDPFRRLIWNNPDVSVHYKQNILLFVKKEKITETPFLSSEYSFVDTHPLDLVHPDKYLQELDFDRVSLKNELLRVYKLLTYRLLGSGRKPK